MTHICISKLNSIGSDNGLSPGRRQAIIWTNAGILLIWPLGTNFSEILIKIYTFSFKKMHVKMSSGKWRPFCVVFNVLNYRNSFLTHPTFPRCGPVMHVYYSKLNYHWFRQWLQADYCLFGTKKLPEPMLTQSIAPSGTCFNEISITFQIFSFNKMLVKMKSAKWRPLSWPPYVQLQFSEARLISIL